MNRKIATKKDIRRAAGHLVICGFHGTALTAELRELLREVEPLGVILFARNIESLEQVCELNRELKAHRAQDPLLTSVDQEGGRVQRMRAPATVWPPMRELGRLGDPALIRRVGAALAQEVRALNFDVNYAPVLDVDTNPKNPVIGDRAFSDDPRVVAAMGAALIESMQGGGVGACGKHFPGHGDTDKDSHLDLPRVEHELPRLRETEWPPFKAAVQAGVGAIMTAHVIVAALDEDVPATLSPKALAPLRSDLGFKGVIISDDVEMKAVANHFGLDEMANKGLQAGIDVFLACKEPEVVLGLYRGILRAVEEEAISHEDLLKAEKRALAWRERFYKAPTPWAKAKGRIGPDAHDALLEEIDARLRAGVA